MEALADEYAEALTLAVGAAFETAELAWEAGAGAGAATAKLTSTELVKTLLKAGIVLD